MPKINEIKNAIDLQLHIQKLKVLEQTQLEELKNTGNLLIQSMSPLNIVKSTLTEASLDGDLKQMLMDTAVGFGAGFIGNKFYVGKSNSFFKKLVGSGIQFLLTNVTTKIIPSLRKKIE